MKTVAILILSGLFAFVTMPPGHHCKLHCIVKGIDKISGKLEVALYNSPETFPKDGKECSSKTIPITRKEIEFTFSIPPGDYAIALYHDENNNDKFDKNLLGVPLEKYGFSNNVRAHLKAPPFRKAMIHLIADTTIIIHLIPY